MRNCLANIISCTSPNFVLTLLFKSVPSDQAEEAKFSVYHLIDADGVQIAKRPLVLTHGVYYM